MSSRRQPLPWSTSIPTHMDIEGDFHPFVTSITHPMMPKFGPEPSELELDLKFYVLLFSVVFTKGYIFVLEMLDYPVPSERPSGPIHSSLSRSKAHFFSHHIPCFLVAFTSIDADWLGKIQHHWFSQMEI